MTGSNLTPDVPTGPATITGYATAATALLTTLLAYLFADGDAQTLGTVASGVIALASLLWTNYGRQKQAVELARAAGLVATYAQPEEGEKIEDLQRELNLLRQMRLDGDEDVLPADTEGLDPEYTGRTGDLQDRLEHEQKDGCG